MTATLPRTPEETVARLRDLTAAKTDLFGVERSALLDTLPFEHARAYLEGDSKWVAAPDGAAQWEAHRTKDVDQVRAAILDYLPFAWGKANGCRGLSARRSIQHFQGMLWLLGPGHDELRQRISGEEEPSTKVIAGQRVPDLRIEFAFYGKPALVAISEAFGFAWRHPDGPDNDEWRNGEQEDPVTADEALGR